MTEKELKRLNRQELLELLLAMSRTEKRLRQKIEELEAQLRDRSIAISESGSLAEASLRLNRMFESADQAVQQYTDNAKARADHEAERILAFARIKAELMLAEARESCRAAADPPPEAAHDESKNGAE